MIEVLIFLAGIHMMMESLVAAYRWIDLWYCISEVFWRVACRSALVLGINAIAVYLMDGSHLQAFILGQASYLVLHLFKFVLARLIISQLGALQKGYKR